MVQGSVGQQVCYYQTGGGGGILQERGLFLKITA